MRLYAEVLEVELSFDLFALFVSQEKHVHVVLAKFDGVKNRKFGSAHELLLLLWLLALFWLVKISFIDFYHQNSVKERPS